MKCNNDTITLAAVSSSDTSSCLQCASSSSYSPAASFGCYSCYAAPTSSRAGCLNCLKQFPATAPPAGSSIAASTGYRASTCGNCAAKEVQAVDFAAKNCYSCVAKTESSSYCSMMVSRYVGRIIAYPLMVVNDKVM